MTDNPHEEVEALVADTRAFISDCLEQRLEGGVLGNLYAARDNLDRLHDALSKGKEGRDDPVKMILFCPACGEQHIDAPEGTGTFDGPGNNIREIMIWTSPPHRSHLCDACGHIWRPADVPTEGVASIATAGKNDSPPYRPSLRDVTEAEQTGWLIERGETKPEMIMYFCFLVHVDKGVEIKHWSWTRDPNVATRFGRKTDAELAWQCATQRPLEDVDIHEHMWCEALQNSRNDGASPQEPQRLAERVGWRPIESAPRDGTWFVALQDGERYPCEWRREEPDEGLYHEGWFDHFNQSFEEPIHWQPLPEPLNE
jgi:hypothetical protein